MNIIINIDSKYFSLNGIPYFKNFIPHVKGGKIRVVNAYDSKLELVGFSQIDTYTVDGNSYEDIALLQAALIPVLFTKASSADGLESVDDGTTVVSPAKTISFPAFSVVDAGDHRAIIYVKFVDVTASRLLSDTDYNATLMIKANVTLTIPASGLPKAFICHCDVFPGYTLTIATATGVTISGNEGMTVEENKMCLIYRDGNTNNYRLRGEV